ncbi:hypothetical protein KK141_03240 [Dyella sp. LX-66]|uniref:hypothetical protein n=1 Tax=unclassified Dyella TaxID=2634549 RepID=UPI001BDFAC50|nr:MULTISPECIES: hypothetical protein [unclassified Dyella]MBT2117485.1 hypothetical protein [Dyella sp. LX-1]MBT2138549.1 hypothetical protein [Dyella sp. LX-66]
MRSFIIGVMLLSFAVAAGIQSLYVSGQIFHLVAVIDKAGGGMPHLISFGWVGVCLYFMLTFIMMAVLAFLIKRKGWGAAKIPALIFFLCVVNTVAMTSLLLLPYSDVVSRS